MEKEYPDLIDPISGEVMRDPVVTSAGQSYSRHELLKHLEVCHMPWCFFCCVFGFIPQHKQEGPRT